MKKVLVIIFAFLYLGVSSGATIHLHYCMGKLVGWGLSDKKDALCKTCGMHKAGHKDCCHDEQKQVKFEKDQKVTESQFQNLNPTSNVVIITHNLFSVICLSSLISKTPYPNGPPRQGTVPVFVLHCNFRI